MHNHNGKIHITSGALSVMVQFDLKKIHRGTFAERIVYSAADVAIGQPANCVQKILVISDIANGEQSSRRSVGGNDTIGTVDDHECHVGITEYGFVDTTKLGEVNLRLRQ